MSGRFRPVWPAFVAAAVWAAGVACGPAPALIRAPSGPAADERAAVVAAAERADDALRLAFARADVGPLRGAFEDRALLLYERQVAGLAARGARREEEVRSREAVHVGGSPAQPEVVLKLAVRQRLVASGPPPPFAMVLRQWLAALARRGDGWVVIDARELPPEQWWR